MGRLVLRGPVTPLGKSGCIRGQQIQFVGPELFDKVAEPAHAFRVEPVIPVSSFFACRHHAGLLQ